MKTVHPPRPDYACNAYLIFCITVTVAWVGFLAWLVGRFIESTPL